MYAGWIPNVSGFLSFSHIGGIEVRNRTKREEVFPPTKFLHERTSLTLWQQRNLSDRPTVGLIGASSSRGEFLFLLQAEIQDAITSGIGMRKLTGAVYCTPYAFRAPLLEIHEQEKRGPQLASISQSLAATITALNGALGEKYFALSFDLCEDGVITFNSLANADIDTNAIAQLLAFEAYSFVKDVLHKHRFHAPTDDALLELSLCDDIRINNEWAQSVARNLHRSVIASFRAPSASAQADGLGKLAYLESFLAIADQRGIQIRQAAKAEPLRKALEAHQSQHIFQNEERSFLFSFVLTALTIVIPVLLISIQSLEIPCVVGITYDKDLCSYQFHMSWVFLESANHILSNLHWYVVGSVLFMSVLVGVVARRKKFVAYNADKLDLQTWTTDLRDLIFRFAVSHSRLVLFALVLTVVIVVAALTKIFGYLLT